MRHTCWLPITWPASLARRLVRRQVAWHDSGIRSLRRSTFCSPGSEPPLSGTRHVRKATTLIAGKFGSRHFGTKPYLKDALNRTGNDKPIVLYVGAASGDDPTFGTALGALMTAAGASRVLWPKLATRRKQAS